MAVIDIGPGAADRDGTSYLACSVIDLNNPANDSGILDTFEVWMYKSSTGGDTKIGTAYGSSTSYTGRDYENIGSVAAGSKQTFTGKNCDVQSGDFIALFCGFNGRVEVDTSGGSGYYRLAAADMFDGASHTFALQSGDIVSLYATGATVAAGSLPLKNVFVGGAWKEITSHKIKVDGAWKTISGIKTKIGGAWK